LRQCLVLVPKHFINVSAKEMNTVLPNDYSFYGNLNTLVQQEPAAFLGPEEGHDGREEPCVPANRRSPVRHRRIKGIADAVRARLPDPFGRCNAASTARICARRNHSSVRMTRLTSMDFVDRKEDSACLVVQPQAEGVRGLAKLPTASRTPPACG